MHQPQFRFCASASFFSAAVCLMCGAALFAQDSRKPAGRNPHLIQSQRQTNPWSNLSPARQARQIPVKKTAGPNHPAGGIASPPPNDNCANAITIFNGDTPFSTIEATTDGPPSFCNGNGDPQINQDIWFNYTATFSDTLTIKLCGSTYDTKMAIYDGCSCPPGAELACNDDFCGLQSSVSLVVTASKCYKLRVGGYLANTGTGNIHIGPPTDYCGNAGHDCCTAGGPGCDDVDCCNAVCAADPFCCDTAWDTICISEVDTYCAAPCPDPCGNAGHDCFTTGAPGCDDVDCCHAVCGADSFCCQVAWDSVCVNEAGMFCGPCDGCVTCPAGALQEAEPCGSDTNGGCNSTPPVYTTLPCNTYMCGTQWADGGFRDTDWYRFTITVAHTRVLWKVWSQFPVVGFILTDDCQNTQILANGGTVQQPLVAEVPCPGLAPGTYIAFVAPASFSGASCGFGNNDYYAILECYPPCIGDITANGAVNVDDLLDLINHWGACPQDGNPCITCPQDVNYDGQVNVDDLLTLILNWGPCPPP